MAVELMGWAFKQKVSPPAKLVLLALADHANGQTGLCIPGQKLLAEQCSMSVRTVQRHLAALEDAGLIRREPRMRGGGRGRTSDRYFLGDQRDKSGPTRQMGTTKATNQDDQHDTRVVAEPEENRKKEPLATHSSSRQRDLLWDAVIEACGWAGKTLTGSERGRTAKAVKELRTAEATPDQVRQKATIYRQAWPNMTLTPTALSGNWTTLETVKPSGQPTYSDAGRGGVYYD
jgi:DNA-binding transcriptional ArsR family regulator